MLDFNGIAQQRQIKAKTSNHNAYDSSKSYDRDIVYKQVVRSFISRLWPCISLGDTQPNDNFPLFWMIDWRDDGWARLLPSS